MQQVIWQGLLEYASNAWDIARKDTNRVAIYDDVLGNYDKLWGGNGLLYRINNTRSMLWDIRMPIVG